MSDYRQPDFYRFSSDSLALVHWVLSEEKHVLNLLDLGAGCGIVGIELAKNFLPQKLNLIEVQKEFLPFLGDNCRTFLPSEVQVQIIHSSFREWQTVESFDVIVCNPPYYLPGNGRSSPSRERNICRSFCIDGWEILLETCKRALSPQGRCYFVLGEDPSLVKLVEELAFAEGLRPTRHQSGKFYFLKVQ